MAWAMRATTPPSFRHRRSRSAVATGSRSVAGSSPNERHPDTTVGIATPARYATPGWYPSAYRVVFDEDAEEPDAYSASVPGKGGTCSCHGVFLPSISAETARTIMLSVSGVLASSLSPASPSRASRRPSARAVVR